MQLSVTFSAASTPTAISSEIAFSNVRLTYIFFIVDRFKVNKLKAMLFFPLQVIRDYTTPPNEELSRDLVNKLKPYIRYKKYIV